MSGLPQPELVGIMPLTTYAGNSAIYLSSAELDGYLPLTGGTMEGGINMGTNPLTNLPEPINPADAATKSYVDTTFGDYLPLAGGTMNAGAIIDMNGGSLEEVTEIKGETSLSINAPTDITIDTLFGTVNINGDDLNLRLRNPGLLRGNVYLDIVSDDNIRIEANGIIDISGSVLVRSDIDMSGNAIHNLATPVLPNDAVNVAYLATITSAYLPLSGGTLTGVLDMSGNTIRNVPLPLADDEAVNKLYVDTAAGAYLPLSGGTLTGVLDMCGNDLQNLGSLTVAGLGNTVDFGTVLPANPALARFAVLSSEVTLTHLDPLTTMTIRGQGDVRVESTAGDLNLVGDDVNISTTNATNVLNITSLGVIQNTAGGAINNSAGGAFAVQAGGLISIVTTGSIQIGSGNVLGATTSIEKLDIDDSVVTKVAGASDLQFQNTTLVQNTGSPLNTLTLEATDATTTLRGEGVVIETTGTPAGGNGDILMKVPLGTVVDISAATGVATFGFTPQCAVAPVAAADLTNKAYVDGAVATRLPNNADISFNFNFAVPIADASGNSPFIYVPAAAGVPTGAPAAIAGCVPLYVDITGGGAKLYVYVSGIWVAI
jgi:hypothetical protein